MRNNFVIASPGKNVEIKNMPREKNVIISEEENTRAEENLG